MAMNRSLPLSADSVEQLRQLRQLQMQHQQQQQQQQQQKNLNLKYRQLQPLNMSQLNTPQQFQQREQQAAQAARMRMSLVKSMLMEDDVDFCPAPNYDGGFSSAKRRTAGGHTSTSLFGGVHGLGSQSQMSPYVTPVKMSGHGGHRLGPQTGGYASPQLVHGSPQQGLYPGSPQSQVRRPDLPQAHHGHQQYYPGTPVRPW